MVDQSIFADLSKVHGYMGAVLSDYTGEVLVEDPGQLKKEALDQLSINFNEDFRDIHEATNKSNVGGTHLLQIITDKATILMMCSGADARVHLHTFAILSKDASTAMAKLELEKILKKAVENL